MKYEFNANIRQWSREMVIPVPKADADKLRLLTKGNIIGERVKVSVEVVQ